MSNKQHNATKIFKCSTCGKADYKEIIPGAVSFFDRCTFTPDCTGRVTLDPNADISARSDLTWRQTPTIFKSSFSRLRTLTLTHNFGHIGSLVVEIFVEVVSTTGITHAKTTAFNVVSQTVDTVTIDLLTPQTGVAVITDNQYKSPVIAATQVAWVAPTLLTANIITIAADKDVASFVAALSYKSLNSYQTQTANLVFQSHHLSNHPVGGTLWAQYKVLAIEKPYFLYSATIPLSLQKGTTVQLTGTNLPTVVIPMAMADKSAYTDIVQTRIIRNSVVRLGDLVVDNNQLVIANSSIIEELRKPFTIY